MSEELPQAIIERLVDNHREFRAYLERKLGDRALAEDILQDAFVRSLDKVESIRDTDSALHWFYRVLRNAVYDHARRKSVSNRRLEAFAQELALSEAEPATMNQICQCVTSLSETLKPEYAEALRRVEVEGMAVKDYAALAGISSSNAGVRIFRAREALHKQLARSCGTCAEHGCLDCTCSAKPAGAHPCSGR